MLLIFGEWGLLQWPLWWLAVLALVLCVGIINAYNFMDGINGITGGYSLAVMLPLLYLNHTLRFVADGFLETAILSLLVFCFFNFRNKARCFAGDVGSVGMAAIVIFALGRLIIQTGNLVYIIFLAVYGVDSVLTIIHASYSTKNWARRTVSTATS